MSSCAKVAVVTPDAHRLSNNHKLIAIDQPFVNIRGFGNNKSDKVFEVEELESQILQENMCKHLPLFLKEEGMYVKVMTYEETFDKFEATTEPLQELNLLGVSQVLEVDAVLQSRYELDGPISQNQAITD